MWGYWATSRHVSGTIDPLIYRIPPRNTPGRFGDLTWAVSGKCSGQWGQRPLILWCAYDQGDIAETHAKSNFDYSHWKWNRLHWYCFVINMPACLTVNSEDRFILLMGIHILRRTFWSPWSPWGAVFEFAGWWNSRVITKWWILLNCYSNSASAIERSYRWLEFFMDHQLYRAASVYLDIEMHSLFCEC